MSSVPAHPQETVGDRGALLQASRQQWLVWLPVAAGLLVLAGGLALRWIFVAAGQA